MGDEAGAVGVGAGPDFPPGGEKTRGTVLHERRVGEKGVEQGGEDQAEAQFVDAVGLVRVVEVDLKPGGLLHHRLAHVAGALHVGAHDAVTGLGEPVDLLQGGERLDPQAQKPQSQRFCFGDDSRYVGEKVPAGAVDIRTEPAREFQLAAGLQGDGGRLAHQGDEPPLLPYPAPVAGALQVPSSVSIREKGAASPVSASTTSFSISAPIPHFSGGLAPRPR